jgi:hypothetical protein
VNTMEVRQTRTTIYDLHPRFLKPEFWIKNKLNMTAEFFESHDADDEDYVPEDAQQSPAARQQFKYPLMFSTPIPVPTSMEINENATTPSLKQVKQVILKEDAQPIDVQELPVQSPVPAESTGLAQFEGLQPKHQLQQPGLQPKHQLQQPGLPPKHELQQSKLQLELDSTKSPQVTSNTEPFDDFQSPQVTSDHPVSPDPITDFTTRPPRRQASLQADAARIQAQLEEEDWIMDNVPFRADPEFLAELHSLEEELKEPTTWQEAIQHPLWKKSMDDEIESLTERGTWRLEHLPKGRKAMKTKWAFRAKRDSSGKIYKLKSRLNACGYSQVFGVDFIESFAPVGNRATMRLLVALAAFLGWNIRQIDFDAAFLNGDLEETLFMQQPHGYNDGSGRACRLLKSIYGLKQAAAVWYKALSRLLIDCGYEPSTKDPCLFLRSSDSCGPAWIYVYVDDLLITGPKGTDEFVKLLSSRYDVKDLGEAEFILGVKTKRNKRGIHLSQQAFSEQLCNEFLENKLKSVKTSLPMELNAPEQDQKLDEELAIRFRSAAGAVGYLATMTRPDISVTFSVLGSYLKEPTVNSWKLLQHTLGYIWHSRHQGLFYRSAEDGEYDGSQDFSQFMRVFSDSDWAGKNNAKRRSRSGFHMLIFGG